MLIPGLGHFYAGFLTRGAIWMGGSIALAAVAVSRENDIRDPRLAAMSVALFVVTVADVLTQLRRRDVPR